MNRSVLRRSWPKFDSQEFLRSTGQRMPSDIATLTLASPALHFFATIKSSRPTSAHNARTTPCRSRSRGASCRSRRADLGRRSHRESARAAHSRCGSLPRFPSRSGCLPDRSRLTISILTCRNVRSQARRSQPGARRGNERPDVGLTQPVTASTIAAGRPVMMPSTP